MRKFVVYILLTLPVAVSGQKKMILEKMPEIPICEVGSLPDSLPEIDSLCCQTEKESKVVYTAPVSNISGTREYWIDVINGTGRRDNKNNDKAGRLKDSLKSATDVNGR